VLQDSLLKHGCVALLAEKLGSPDVDMRIAAAWSLANLAYGASDAARAALLTQLPAAAVVTALHDQHSSVQVRAWSCLWRTNVLCRKLHSEAPKAARKLCQQAAFLGTRGIDCWGWHLLAHVDSSVYESTTPITWGST